MNLVVGLIGGLGLLALILALFFRQRVLAVKIEDGAANPEELARLKEISSAIAEGAMAFLSREYRVLAIFMALFAVVIFATVQHGLETAVAFLIGAGTSVAAGYIGMRIATVGNVRTASAARVSLQKSFSVAFESGAVMGFGLTGLAVIGLILVWLGIDAFIPGLTAEQQMEILSGFGLGEGPHLEIAESDRQPAHNQRRQYAQTTGPERRIPRQQPPNQDDDRRKQV